MVRRRILPTLGVIVLAVVARAPRARAVPIPWKNCGKPTDILQVQQLTASVWPPAGASAPLAGAATLDATTGAAISLNVVLALGTEWTFESVGNLGASNTSGFVALPSSVPMTLLSPSLPLSAGPLSIMRTFTVAGKQPITVVSKGVLAKTLTSAVASLSLTFNGIAGFPNPPTPGTYEATLRLTTADGQEVFCLDQILTGTSFIGVTAPAAVPTLSGAVRLGLIGMLVASGVRSLRARRKRVSRARI
jgi:hypothetical protein